jgi:hypothetical protein
MAKKKKITRTRRKKQVHPIVQKAHPWRVCPLGHYYRKEHPRTNPSGSVSNVRGHCSTNPSGRDQLYYDELIEMSQSEAFNSIKRKPTPNPFDFGTKGNSYDQFIAGWVQYWNDVLKPEQKLDPDLVKALIASESSFREKLRVKASARNYANGLMQVTDQTLDILRDEDGELTDQYITITKKEILDPDANICAGIRWLFQKKKLASGKLGRDASWEETVGEYKSAFKSNNPNSLVYDEHTMKDFRYRYQWIKTGVKPNQK